MKGFGGADRSHHIGLDHANDLLIRKSFQRSRHAIAGIIENHVHSTHGQGFIHGTFDLLWIGDIQWQQYDAGEFDRVLFPCPDFAWWR